VTTAPIPEQARNTSTASTGRSIFEDPAIGEAAKNDAFVQFVAKNWRSLLLTLVTVGAAMVGYNVFTTTALEKRARATTILSDIQENYQGLVDKQAGLAKLREEQQSAQDDVAKKKASDSIETSTKEINEARTKIALMIDSLDSPPPFDSYATLYRGLLASRFGDYEAVEKALQSAPSWEAIDDVRSSKRYIAETIHLGLLKSLAQSDAHRAAVKEKLKELADKGEFLAVDALAAYSLVAEAPADQDSLKQAIEALRSKFPSQGKYLDLIAERSR
jgi:hypothetical protein